MAVNGVPQRDIAEAMKLDPKTLRKFYRDSLDYATVILCARVARHLGKIATTGHSPATVSACRYISGSKAGWKDTTHIEVEPSGGEGLSGLMTLCGVEPSDARARILARLDAINVGPPEPGLSEGDIRALARCMPPKARADCESS